MNIKKSKLIFTIGLAQQLLRMGNSIIDVIHHRDNNNMCIFVFDNTPKLKIDLDYISLVRAK